MKIYFDADNMLHIAAAPVPEPESYAMLLAGLGMIGFMARRRLGKRALSTHNRHPGGSRAQG